MLSVITNPNYIPNTILQDGFINADIVATHVAAYSDGSQTPQSLTLGATSNVNVESVQDINMFMGLDNAYRLFTSTYSTQTQARTDTEFLTVQRSSGNTTLITTPSNLSFQPEDLQNSTIALGSLKVSLASSNQVFDTDAAGFALSKSLQVSGGLSVSDNIVTSGSLFGKNMNIWEDKDSSQSNSAPYNRIGFGMRINAYDELEIVKYAKFADESTVLKKVAVFGVGALNSNMNSDTSSNYLVFNSLGQVSVSNGSNTNIISGGGGGEVTSTSNLTLSGTTLSGTTLLNGDLAPLLNYGASLGSSTAFLRNIFSSNIVTPSGSNLLVNGYALLSSSLALASHSNAASSHALSNAYGTASQALNVANAALPAAGGTVSGDLSVGGNLTIAGTTTSVNTTTMTVNDNVITLNNNQTGTPPSILKSGVEVNRGSLSNYYFLFEESSQLFKVGQSNTLQAVCTRDDAMASGYLYFNSDLQKATNRTLTVADVPGLVSSQWTTSNNNVYYATNFGDTSNVGIGYSNPSYKLAVNGQIFAADDITAFSDVRVKDNITTIGGALDKVAALRGCTYTRKDKDSSTLHMGVIAQEVQAVLPEVVSTDAAGYLSVAYGNMVAVLIEAVKELKVQLGELKTQIKV